MQEELMNAISSIANQYLMVNYDMVWLKTMLKKGQQSVGKGTLITGSSHALNGINEKYIDNCVNCSMHSQDIYYDFLCAKTILEKAPANAYIRCFIIMGYYIPFQDLSKSTVMRNMMISPVYYPVFGDAHNWHEPERVDPWRYATDTPEEARKICEMLAEQLILQKETYYSDLKQRKSFFDLGGRRWCDLSQEEMDAYGKERALSHNKMVVHEASFIENCDILKDYVRLLQLHNITPAVVITPFTPAYNKYIDNRYREAVVEMLDKVEGTIHYIDFNDSDMFDETDFMDTDHLNAAGADKVSFLLNDLI